MLPLDMATAGPGVPTPAMGSDDAGIAAAVGEYASREMVGRGGGTTAGDGEEPHAGDQPEDAARAVQAQAGKGAGAVASVVEKLMR